MSSRLSKLAARHPIQITPAQVHPLEREKPHNTGEPYVGQTGEGTQVARHDNADHETGRLPSSLQALSSVRVGEYDPDGFASLGHDSTGTWNYVAQDETQAARTSPRLKVKPVHTLVMLLILLAALSTSLTLLLQQTVNIARVGDTQSAAMPTESNSNQLSANAGSGDDSEQTSQNAQPYDSGTVEPSEQAQSSQDSASAPASSPASSAPTDTKINLNTASVEELQTLSGVGPVMSQRIVDYRTQIGGYTSVDELLDVKGIGTKTLENLRPMVKVG